MFVWQCQETGLICPDVTTHQTRFRLKLFNLKYFASESQLYYMPFISLPIHLFHCGLQESWQVGTEQLSKATSSFEIKLVGAVKL